MPNRRCCADVGGRRNRAVIRGRRGSIANAASGKAGEQLDGIGGFCSYGLVDNASTARGMGALPIGLSEGCVLRRDVSKDDVICFDDVDAIPGGIAHTLWLEQNALWPTPKETSRESSAQPILVAGA